MPNLPSSHLRRTVYLLCVFHIDIPISIYVSISMHRHWHHHHFLCMWFPCVYVDIRLHCYPECNWYLNSPSPVGSQLVFIKITKLTLKIFITNGKVNKYRSFSRILWTHRGRYTIKLIHTNTYTHSGEPHLTIANRNSELWNHDNERENGI